MGSKADRHQVQETGAKAGGLASHAGLSKALSLPQLPHLLQDSLLLTTIFRSERRRGGMGVGVGRHEAK